jgi:circadian clock protein KaiC
VGIDSFKAIHDMAKDFVEVRKFGFDLSVRLTTWAVTAFFVGEYTQHEIEEEPIFAIADGIVRMHYQQQGLSYQRFIDVLKMRGEGYFNGMHPFTIDYHGLKVFPRIKTPPSFPNYTASLEHVSTGLQDLDDMIDGGLPRGTATMVAGGAGTGKTLIGLHFITAGTKQQEPGVIVTFQENPAQLREIVRSFGWNLEDLEQQGMLVHLYNSPVEIQPDIHVALIREAVERVGARRILIDSIKDIEIATPDKVRFKDYIYSIVNEFKAKGITLVLTNEIPELFGGFQLSEYGVSFIADNVILLRYVELLGRMEHVINILKVRGSKHSKEIRKFEITGNGIRIGDMLKEWTGILTGTPSRVLANRCLDLPLRARYVVESLQQLGATSQEELARLTGLSLDILVRELESLQLEGVVEQLEHNTEAYYKLKQHPNSS